MGTSEELNCGHPERSKAGVEGAGCVTFKVSSRNGKPGLADGVGRVAASISLGMAVFREAHDDYLSSNDAPAVPFAFPIPIFFKNGCTDCLRPRNLSIDSLTSRESPMA